MKKENRKKKKKKKKKKKQERKKSKKNITKKKQQKQKTGIPPVLNSLNPNQNRQNVGPDLDSNCLHRLPAGNTGRQCVEIGVVFLKVNCSL